MINQISKRAKGKLGVLLPGMGAVASTFIAGCLAIRKGLSTPIGSVSQLGDVALDDGKRSIKIGDLVPLAAIEDLCFGGWDIFEENMYDATVNAQVIDRYMVEQIKEDLSSIKPMSAVFSNEYIKNITGPNVKTGKNKMDLANQLIDDINRFKKENGCDRLVMIWCGSTEKYVEGGEVHETVEKLEEGLRNNDPNIPPSMIYTYAAMKCGIPYANGAPNLSCDVPAMVELSRRNQAPIAGKDYKTGQTLMKTIVAPGLKVRYLGIDGWFSTNILGNRDGEVLDDPANFKTKEVSKLGVLQQILEPEKNPDLYGDMYHKVRINYYPPRGDNKEGWDNIDIRGWMNYDMQIKIDFLCRDSILAAPLVLDLALFLDLAKRCGESGVQDWLSFYLKSPQDRDGQNVIHDIFKQEALLHKKLIEFSKTA